LGDVAGKNRQPKSIWSWATVLLYERLAFVLNADRETALRLFVLVVALLLDPAAVVLLLAATSARR
jgi:hypothetical protein